MSRARCSIIAALELIPLRELLHLFLSVTPLTSPSGTIHQVLRSPRFMWRRKSISNCTRCFRKVWKLNPEIMSAAWKASMFQPWLPSSGMAQSSSKTPPCAPCLQLSPSPASPEKVPACPDMSASVCWFLLESLQPTNATRCKVRWSIYLLYTAREGCHDSRDPFKLNICFLKCPCKQLSWIKCSRRHSYHWAQRCALIRFALAICVTGLELQAKASHPPSRRRSSQTSLL